MAGRLLSAKLRGVCLAALLAAATAFGGGGPAAAETLLDALTAAYRWNPRLDAARATLRATDEEVPRAKSGYRPVITGSADAGFQRTNTSPPSQGDGEAHPRGYDVSATQPIFRGWRTTNAVREAEANVRAGRETLRITEQTVLLDAVTAYVDVVRDQAIVRLRENNVAVLTRELRATRDRFAVGEVTRTDVAQSEARRELAVSDLETARANLKSSRANYERIVGHPPSNLMEPPPLSKLLPQNKADAVRTAEQENPNVITALYREQASRHAVDRIRGELLPEVRLEATYQHRYDTSRTNDESEQTRVTGRVTVPLYEAGEVSARVRQAKQTHVGRLQEIEQARTEVEAAVAQAWYRLGAARALIISDQAQVTATRTALAGVREEERVGQRTLLDVLNAEQEALNAEVRLVGTRRDLVVASYNLLGSIGRLNADTLGLGGLIYDPEAHYHEVRRKWFGVTITHDGGRREYLQILAPVAGAVNDRPSPPDGGHEPGHGHSSAKDAWQPTVEQPKWNPVVKPEKGRK